MEDRGFNEVELRGPAVTRGRYSLRGLRWIMTDRYLEVTFRDGKPFAAYLYLRRAEGARSARTESAGAGLVVDYAGDGTPIGLEITAPGHVSFEAINSVLDRIGQPRMTAKESAPLAAA